MEDNKSFYGAIPLNLSRDLKRTIDNTAKRGLRPEEITILKLSKKSRGEKKGK